MANATDTFVLEYTAVLATHPAKAPKSLIDACCALVRQLKMEGFQPEQVLAYLKLEISRAGGNRSEMREANDDMIAQCIEEYFKAPMQPRG